VAGAAALNGPAGNDFARAAALIAAADGLLITAGAGIGVDSGLPDFRGTQGFWRAYPALAAARIAFEEIANPTAFATDPRLAWGFYGHRLNLYRHTVPHAGFAILREIAARLPQGGFVFTSNVDGQFQRAGFDAHRICECHGSIHHLQCTRGCVQFGDADYGTWAATDFAPEIDEAACRISSPMPRCPACNALARPNILMFDDGAWLAGRSEAQRRQLEAWLEMLTAPVVIEIGAGTQIPTVRWFGELRGAPLIRINPSEPELASANGVSLAMGGRAGLEGIAGALRASGFLDEHHKDNGWH
jgi:NAD-dependent SIR2 family protein deacetylase